MTEEIERLRKLRDRVDSLRENIVSDLKVFLHQRDFLTFRRKPDSESREGDVNVTTTCSCVMALALTNQFADFYKCEKADDIGKKAFDILKTLIGAPWMSSGLTANNAFTTSLVLRAHGFLASYKILGTSFALRKRWDLELTLTDVVKFGETLKEQGTELAIFLFRSLTDETRSLIDKGRSADKVELGKRLTADLRHIVHNGWIYQKDRFPMATEGTLEKLKNSSTAYKIADVNHDLLYDAFPDQIMRPVDSSLAEIAAHMASSEDNFRINNYPPAAPVVYWFLDGISRSDFQVDERGLQCLVTFAAKEFMAQRSLLAARYDARMDPVTLGMAACLCARLRQICETGEGLASGKSADHLTKELPSRIELEHSIKEVLQQQNASGIWSKYFPMFHYQEAGSNFCFTFELLEAILHEFGHEPYELFTNDQVVDAISKAVRWCEENRLAYHHSESTYSGWSSGGDIKSLKDGKPESWATAVVHMFLWETSSILSYRIQKAILSQYRVEGIHITPNESALNDLLDVEVRISDKAESLRNLLKSTLIKANRGRSETDLRRVGAKKPVSALLFGPPGTSKTQLAKAVAKALGWPLLIIDPSDFVKESLEKVYTRSDQIFRDLIDLAAVVVLFDEMDALMQSREDSGLETEAQFLTTSMLPKLTQLHETGKVVFLMATNYQSRFDPALKRSGRFDFLLCVGPPTLEEKIKELAAFYRQDEIASDQKERAQELIREFAGKDSWVSCQLELFTFGEFKEFLGSIGTNLNIGDALKELGKEVFQKKVRSYSEHSILRMDSSSLLRTFTVDTLPVESQPTRTGSELMKYLNDRRESKKQG